MPQGAGLDVLDHVRMEGGADGGNEERGRRLVLLEQAQDARQAVDGAVFAAGDHFVIQIAAGEGGRRIVDVEAERHGHASVAGPGLRLEAAAGGDVKHLRPEVVEGEGGARLRDRSRLLGRGSGGNCNDQGNGECDLLHDDLESGNYAGRSYPETRIWTDPIQTFVPES